MHHSNSSLVLCGLTPKRINRLTERMNEWMNHRLNGQVTVSGLCHGKRVLRLAPLFLFLALSPSSSSSSSSLSSSSSIPTKYMASLAYIVYSKRGWHEQHKSFHQMRRCDTVKGERRKERERERERKCDWIKWFTASACNSCAGEIRPVLLLNLPCLCKCLPTFHSSPNVAYSHSIRLNHLSLNGVKLLVIPFVYIQREYCTLPSFNEQSDSSEGERKGENLVGWMDCNSKGTA